ncbi:MAG: FAD-binding and (Fe-S)-binding domain-containing protein [Natronomonas sp.]
MAVEDEFYDPDGYDTSASFLGHDRPDSDEYVELATALRERVRGEVQFDEYAQVLYASDGSIYQARPAGVVCPVDTDDVRRTVETAAEYDVPVLPRGAGSSLAGQAVGPGCIVLDFTRHMDDVINVDPDDRLATVQPGVVQDHLDTALEPHGLKFAPDPASSNRATIGGGIGNNSTGAHSVRYGITDAYTEELQVVLSDGSLIHTRDVVVDGPEYDRIVKSETLEARIYETVRELVADNEDEIESRYPTLKRSVSGYNLHKVISTSDDGETVINLSKLFVGAEGTLGVIVEATVSLVSKPDETALALYCFDDLVEALRAVPEALEYPVSAVELMDDEVFRLARESDGYAEYAEPIPDDAAAALMLEWDDELVDDFEAAIAETNDHFLTTAGSGEFDSSSATAFDVIEAYSADAQDRLWKLRKAAIPLLMSLEGDPKPYPFIEDATVPPEELATYVQSFQEVLETHDTTAAYFAHAGSGTLHIRPILNLKDADGIETMRSITDDVTDLVLDHHGAFSGEHGDGMARTEFNPKMYGEDLWSTFKTLKTAFDPEWLLHPGNVVYRDDPDDPGPDSARGVGADMREHLRYGPEYRSLEPTTALNFSESGGFSQLVELCNGCGTCRQTDSDVMCPTYRASKEEVQTTRGRANMLRAAISGELPESELHTDRFQKEVLDLCVGCKGCSNDCPTGVDFAKLKAELKHDYHESEGATIRERLFGNIDRYASLGSMFAPASNFATKIPGARVLLDRTLGIAKDRELPTFRRRRFVDWYEERGPRIDEADASARVVVFPDTFTNYSYPAPGKAAVEVLEAAGVHVHVPTEVGPSGRAAYSKGFLDRARDRAAHNIECLRPYVDDDWDILFVEPADAVMFQDEYRDLLTGADVDVVSGAAYGVMEYFDRFELDKGIEFDSPGESLAYHGHCNQKATNRDHHAVGVLRRAGYDVDAIDSTCCGMAGSFGYESEHYDLSRAIGEILFRQVERSTAETVTAPGASCRTQLADRPDAPRPPHPVEKLADAIGAH